MLIEEKHLCLEGRVCGKPHLRGDVSLAAMAQLSVTGEL